MAATLEDISSSSEHNGDSDDGESEGSDTALDDSSDEDGEEWETDEGEGSEEENDETGDESDEDDEDGSEGDEEEDDDEEEEGSIANVGDIESDVELEANAVLEASDTDEEGERCPICLNRFKGQDVGTPESCDHVFCLECIQLWAKNVNVCPLDRQVFKLIFCKHDVDDIIYKKLPVEDRHKSEGEEDEDEEATYCEVCGQCDREDRMLLCDGCDAGYHLECLTPPLSSVPVDEWFCPQCSQSHANEDEQDADYVMTATARPRRQIGRTMALQRVRHVIAEIRVARTRRLQQLDTSSEEEITDVAVKAGPSQHPAKKSTPKKPPRKRRTTKKKRKAKRKRVTKRKTNKKKAAAAKKSADTSNTSTVSTTKKRRRKRKRRTKGKGKGRKRKSVKRTKRTSRAARQGVVTTVKSRIAGALGLSEPPTGRTIPMQKMKLEKSIDGKRADIGASSLSIFGHREELLHFEDEIVSRESNTHTATVPSRYSNRSLSTYKPIGRVPIVAHKKPKGCPVVPAASQPSSIGASGGPLDLLGAIMEGQNRLQLSSKQVTIQRDGSLVKNTAEPVSISTADGSSKSHFKSSFTAVQKNVDKKTSVLSSLVKQKSETDEYDPAHPTDEWEDDVDKKDIPASTEDVYDPAHPTDDISSEEENDVKTEECNQMSSLNIENTKDKNNVACLSVENTSSSNEANSSSSNDTSNHVFELSKQNKHKENVKAIEIEQNERIKDEKLFDDEPNKKLATNNNPKSENKVVILNTEPINTRVSPSKPVSSKAQISPSVKITESTKKFPAKPFEINRKALFEKKRLYGGNEDFSEDVDFCEGAFPESREVDARAIEEAFKGTLKSKQSDSKLTEDMSSKTVEIDKNTKTEEIKEESSVIKSCETKHTDITKNADVEPLKVDESKDKALKALDKEQESGAKPQKDIKSKKVKEKDAEIHIPVNINLLEKDEKKSPNKKMTVSDRFKKISKESNLKAKDLEEEDPIHEMRKLDKELDFELGDSDYGKKKDKENRKSKRKFSAENDELYYEKSSAKNRRESKEYGKQTFIEIEDGEVDDDSRRERRKNEKKKKKQKDIESDIDKRIVIQVSQNNEDRTVWEEEERKARRKKEKEEKSKTHKKHRSHRTRSISADAHRRSRSRDRRRSRSRNRSHKKRRVRSRDKSRSRSVERSQKKKKKDKDRSREKSPNRNRSRHQSDRSQDRSREREDYVRERDLSVEDDMEKVHRRKFIRDRSVEHVDIFGRSRSPFARKEFLKEKEISKRRAHKAKDDENGSTSLKKLKYEEISSDSDKMSPHSIERIEKIETVSRIEVKKPSVRDSPIFDENVDKDEDFDDEPEETEQFQYTDRDEYLGQHKNKQQRQNLITIGISDASKQRGSTLRTPPLPEQMSIPTPPLPTTADFTQFPPPPPGPPPSGPPPGTVIIQERPPLHLPPGGPPGQGILGEGPILLHGPPPVNINVLPPGFHRGLPPSLGGPQRPLLMSPLGQAIPRVQRMQSPGVGQFAWQVTSSADMPSQFGGPIVSPGVRMGGTQLLNGPFDGLPPRQSDSPHNRPPGMPHFSSMSVGGAGDPPQLITISTTTPPPSIVQLSESPRNVVTQEPPMMNLGPDPRIPPPRLPIPLLPPISEPSLMSVMVSMPPPHSGRMSGVANSHEQSFTMADTPPNSVSAILGLARIGTGNSSMASGSQDVAFSHFEKISALLNTQAKLAKGGESDVKSNGSSALFKVPLPPGYKAGKNEIETTEVIDMDMGSPIAEEGNIELPVSPQFDNLIDNPEDLLEEDFNKKMQKLNETLFQKLKDRDTKIANERDTKIANERDTKIANEDSGNVLERSDTAKKVKELKESMLKKDSSKKPKDEKHKKHSKENRHHLHRRKEKEEAEKDITEKAMKDAQNDLDGQDLPSSAVDMTNKEKYLKKLHLQERVVEEVKMAVKPFYSSKRITKEQYKEILRKAVPKICHSKSGNINPNKIKSLVEAYVEKMTKHSKDAEKSTDSSPSVMANGEWVKAKAVR
ncbi:protein SCAF11-like [Dreissena polymorpha]|uniref:protein SCAF11-like n=1 Tax=Dreissena polymorpha TaxID=45954 RepID=UPI002264D419|nr:protein SCAF11-like [Dreissena polymorpha]XP_052270448.1 protein SCAF11-like [Dreissena polymorpha]XP_052270449.1 protein SCAF11-like [Dreissena polymorpha]XP_052270450.1 protein SCAF11-like [Dreissena polymorpha]XP_052270451.1 protein SCAF11-like [Dreissena polymorpha]